MDRDRVTASRKRSIKRAQRWVEQHQQSASRLSDRKLTQLGALFVCREVIKDSWWYPDSLSFMNNIKKIAEQYQAKPHARLRVSLTNPRESRRYLNAQLVDIIKINDQLEETIADFPKNLLGVLGQATIVGRRDNEPGMRYIGFSLDESTTSHLRKERQKILKASGMSDRPRIMQVPLLATSDQKAAEAIESQLNELNPGRDISFELGPATIARIETHDLHPNYWN
jgi:hypothetical protein